MRYRLRTLLILMALGPPLLAGAWQCYDWLFAPPLHEFSYSYSGGREGRGRLWIDGKEYPYTMMNDPDWLDRLDD